MDDFENFEFIDYTTSGPWERFITQIEDSLRSWGLVDNSLGVFDPAAIAASEDSGSDDTSTPNPARVSSTGKDRSSSRDSTVTQTHSPKNSTSKVYQLREMLSLDDATYALSYQYHPAKIRLAEGVERIDLDFLPISLEGVAHHSLHRWTAQTHILIISPVTISDIFTTSLSSSSSSASSAIIDLSSAKLLLSSFAIAFQNTGCNIPVFVPTGQPWNMTFTGLMIQSMPSSSTPSSDQPDLLDDEYDNDGQAIEVRFNTVHVPYPPVQYTHLSGIMDYFIERMGIEDDDPASSPGNHSQSTKEQIHASALFSYDLVNWRDEDWKRWGNPQENESRRASSSRDRNGDVTAFHVDEEPTMNTPSDSVNIEDMKIENRALSLLPIPVLPFGPVQDPLKSLRLLARFASAPCTVYLDSKNFADMDASYANIWILHATFKEGDYGILSGIMEDAIASWSSESVRQGRADGKAPKDQTYSDALLNKGAKLIQGTITMVDTMDVENIIDALFEMPVVEPSTKSTPTTKLETECGVRIIPASELGLHFKHATTVPYNSFLWRMIQYLLDVISPNSNISYATSVMGFLKVLWSELLKQFYARWENSLLIPMVDIYGGTCESESGSDGERKPVAIDLRYNLLHQKLSMLNCCIARQITRNKETSRDVHPVLKRRKEKVIVEDNPELNPSLSSGSGTTSPTSEQTYGAQFQNLLYGLSDISRPRSADVVPMAKRLLKNVKNRAVSSQQGSTSPSPTASSLSFGGSKTEPSSPTASMPIPQVEAPRRRHSSSRHSSQHLFRPKETITGGDDDDDDDVFYDPMETSEVILDPMEMQRRAHSQSLTESFVALKYSSSADSQSGILVNDLDQMTVSASGPDPREIADPHKSEGGLKPLKDLKLLETGAPLMIPKLQEPGYMTEDMIQQQEELFETLGSSSDGAKMRAKMQSTQLISDMEAFKAANPGCVLGDFIRWHSPKDWAEDKRQMSSRMADAGNYWQELWANSKRIPVSRQTPLFNYNQEAAKVLYYLDSLSGDQLFLNLLPSMCLLAYDTLVSHPVASHIRQVAIGLRELAKELTVFPWNELTAGEEDLHLDVVIEKFRVIELLMGRAIALIRKFPGQYGLVERILEDLETVVEDGDERECVYDLFSIGGSLQSSFPQPTSREFVLETFDPSDMSDFTSSSSSPSAIAPGPIAGGWHTRPLQRRMYACFKESEVRIVEAVAKDGMYM
ncbi:Rab3 GTPase-activating protein catalytic subunit [Linnemannia schmuckeri]|uniref:Rab3 GTPase-activating protein catalytic subunit n=1 Tax=Linnemannia schmuckeri TaxID=64567 RepID=A0A9P5S1N7_9FUNG|nr:Rab3 GTPase-activating protein catalytic subunit [Linnemannia schmuckeri]